jgi:hypothetical protein
MADFLGLLTPSVGDYADTSPEYGGEGALLFALPIFGGGAASYAAEGVINS